MSETTLSPERVARREKIKLLTATGARLYDELQVNSKERNALILAEMQDDPPATPRELTEITGLTIARIYKLRDNAKRGQADGSNVG